MRCASVVFTKTPFANSTSSLFSADVLDMEDQLKRLEALTNRLEAVANRISAPGVNGHANGSDGSAADIDHLPVLRDYNAIVTDSVKPFLAVSNKIGGELTTMNEHVGRLFELQQQFIKRAVQSKKPNDQQIMDFIKPQSSEMEAITGLRSTTQSHARQRTDSVVF